MQLKLENKYLEVLIEDGFISEIRSKANKFAVTAKKIDNPFNINIRTNVDASNVTSYGEPGVQTSKRRIGFDGINPIKDLPVKFINMQKNDIDKEIIAVFQVGDWEFTLKYQLKNASIVITYLAQYLGKEENYYINEASFALPTLKFEQIPTAEQRLVLYDLRSHTCELDTPLSAPIEAIEGFDYIPKMPHRMGAMDCDFHHEIDFLISAMNNRLFGWGREQKGETLSYTYAKSEDGLSFAPTFWCFDKIRPHKVMTCGEFIITPFCAEDSELKEKCYEIKRSFDWSSASTEMITDGCIYQKHGFIADGGGLAKEIEELQHLKNLGISVVYLPPLSPPEAYVNDWGVPIAPCYGTPEELRRYTDEAHKLGMKVICDMIIHDLFRGSKLIEEHPEFIRRDEVGNFASCFIGSVMTETTNKSFRSYYGEMCKFLIKECGLDGFRFDVAAFQLPGWKLDDPAIRPGMTVAAQTQFLQQLYAELSEIKPIIFLEEGMGVAGIRYVSHGYIPFLRFLKSPETELLPTILERLAKLSHYRFLKDRPDVQTMLHLKIHDTALLQRFGRNIIGGDLSLLRWTLTAECVPFLTDMIELGVTDEIKFLLALRRELPEFGFGESNYFDIQKSNGNLFCFTREKDGEKSFVCINFSNEKICDTIAINNQNIEGQLLYAGDCNQSKFLGNGEFEIAENGIIIVKIAGEKIYTASSQATASNCKFSDLSFSSTFEYSAFPEPSFRDSKRKTFDEGSFSEVEDVTNADQSNSVCTKDSWYKIDYDDSNWEEVFRPATRQPYSFSHFVPNVPYVESRLAWGHTMLWSRDKSLAFYDKSFFRAEFELAEVPKVASMRLFSPSHYDFDIAAANFGNVAKMMAECNKVQAFINGVKVFDETERSWDDVAPIDTKLLKKGKNLIAFSAANGFGSRGGCCGIYLDNAEKSIPLNFVSMPSKFDLLTPPKVKNGENFTITNAINASGFKTVKITLDRLVECSLIGENGRILSQDPLDTVYRVNAYSGAIMPILRSDEFFSINENFSLKIGNILCQSFTPGTIGMVFKKANNIEVVFCSCSKEFELNIKEI